MGFNSGFKGLISLPVLRQDRSLFQIELATECDLVLPVKLQYFLFSLTSSNSCLHLLPRFFLPVGETLPLPGELNGGIICIRIVVSAAEASCICLRFF